MIKARKRALSSSMIFEITKKSPFFALISLWSSYTLPVWLQIRIQRQNVQNNYPKSHKSQGQPAICLGDNAEIVRFLIPGGSQGWKVHWKSLRCWGTFSNQFNSFWKSLIRGVELPDVFGFHHWCGGFTLICAVIRTCGSDYPLNFLLPHC